MSGVVLATMGYMTIQELRFRDGALVAALEAGIKAYKEGDNPTNLKEKLNKFKKAISVAKAKRAEHISSNRYEHNPFFKKAFDRARAEGRKMTRYEKLKAHLQFCVPEMLKDVIAKEIINRKQSLSR